MKKTTKKKMQTGGDPAKMKQYDAYQAKAKGMGMTDPQDQRFYARQQMRANRPTTAPAKMQDGGNTAKTKAGQFIQDVANAAKSLKRTPAQSEARAKLVKARKEGRAEMIAARRGNAKYQTSTKEYKKKGGSLKKMQGGGPFEGKGKRNIVRPGKNPYAPKDSKPESFKDQFLKKRPGSDKLPSDSTIVSKIKNAPNRPKPSGSLSKIPNRNIKYK